MQDTARVLQGGAAQITRLVCAQQGRLRLNVAFQTQGNHATKVQTRVARSSLWSSHHTGCLPPVREALDPPGSGHEPLLPENRITRILRKMGGRDAKLQSGLHISQGGA